MDKRRKKPEVSVEIDKLTNSIENNVTGEIFETEFSKVRGREIKKKDWLFDWQKELTEGESRVYKMTTVENKGIIQGLISIIVEDRFVTINIVENAKFNRGKKKQYQGVAGNMFAFACKQSMEMGFGGFVGFVAKTSLIKHYQESLGAELAFGQRMFIPGVAAEKLINQYFKTRRQ
jgi:hypothetical protein